MSVSVCVSAYVFLCVRVPAYVCVCVCVCVIYRTLTTPDPPLLPDSPTLYPHTRPTYRRVSELSGCEEKKVEQSPSDCPEKFTNRPNRQPPG